MKSNRSTAEHLKLIEKNATKQMSERYFIYHATRNVLFALGAWPSIGREESMRPQAYNFLLICVIYTLLFCELLPGILYWLMEKSTRIRLQTIPLLLYDILSVSEYGIFIFRRDQLGQCLKHVEEDWNNIISADMRNIMWKSTKTGKYLAKICGIFMYTGAFIFRTILPLSQGKTVTDQNITIRPFACPGYFFSLDIYVSPVYEILFTIQCLTGIVMVSIVISACGLTAIFVVHACGQLKILIGLMRNLVQESWLEEHEVDKKLAQIVKHQIRVRSFLKLVQHTLQEIYLIEIMVNTIATCVLLYFMILDWQNKNITVLCIYLLTITNVTTHIFIFCYTGEQLTGQAEKVAIESCELEWYRLPNKKARNVILLMIMSNTPTKLSAGKFVDLSLKTFGDIMKTSGAYFNMLRNVIE